MTVICALVLGIFIGAMNGYLLAILLIAVKKEREREKQPDHSKERNGGTFND